MTRVPGNPVGSTSFRTTAGDDNTSASNAADPSASVSEYGGTRFCYSQPCADQSNRGSLMARKLANIAAKLAATKRRLAARRQRRGAQGAGEDDDFVDDVGNGAPGGHRRAEAGDGTGGGGGGSGGQSHHDQHDDSWSEGSSEKPRFKISDARPIQAPPPGALAARIALAGGNAIDGDLLANDLCDALVSLSERLSANPNHEAALECFNVLLDLQQTKLQFGPLKPQGMAMWREKLIARRGTHPVELRPQGLNALLPLFGLVFDAVHVTSRLNRSTNMAATLRNASAARHKKH